MDNAYISQFLTKLRDQMHDEEHAHTMYMSLAEEANRLGFTSTARELRYIAKEELRHYRTLNRLISTISKLRRVR